MPPLPRRQLVPRNSTSDRHYAIIFALVGAVVVICGILWGYFLPKWREKRQKPVQTRYNCNGGTTKHPIRSDHDLELPVIFPPHPAVVVPLAKKRKSNTQVHVPTPNLIPVYDPRSQSPFLNTPRAASCRPSTSEVSTRKKTALSASKPIYLHTARLQRSYSQNPTIGQAAANTRSTSTRHRELGYIQEDSLAQGRCSLLVPRSAGAPPVKPKATRLASEKLKYQLPSRKIPATLSASSLSTVTASDCQDLPRRQSDRDLYPRATDVGERTVKEATLNSTKKPICTPGQVRFGFHNIFETPSSLGTATTTRFSSSPNPLHPDSTPLTAPNSSGLQPRGGPGPYPGISKLVPSKRFKDYVATASSTPCRDAISGAISCLSTEKAYDQTHILGIGHRPVSAPPCSRRQAAIADRDLADHSSIPEFDSVTDIHLSLLSTLTSMPRLGRKLSPQSQSSSVDSLDLFPRPLTFRRTITSQSPLISPTPLGRHVQDIDSPRASLHREFTDLRPVTRGKSPRFKRHTRRSTAFCRPGKQLAVSELNVSSAYPNLEGNPFTDRLGLARLGGNSRRSSIASLSTLKIPKWFRPSISRGGSSVYSRETRGMSVLPSPGFVSEISVSLKSLPELSLRRATSVDETIFQDLDWTPEDADAGHDISTTSDLEMEDCVGGHLPQTPTLPDRPSSRETPKVGTASSDAFGAEMSAPKISVARSSDDVFGGGPMPGKSNDIVVENGRVFKRIRAMESKLSQEDLARYGGRTAPGGVEWF